jgi:hypothetical protein
MAKTTEAVEEMLSSLKEKLAPFADKEIEAMRK